MLRCFAIERRGNSVSLGEVRWAIATLRDLGRTSADRLDPRFPFGGNFVDKGFCKFVTKKRPEPGHEQAIFSFDPF